MVQKEADDMTYLLDLLFRKPSKGQLAGPPIAQIYVKIHGRDEEGHVLVTPRCVSLKEIEEEIDRLKKELEVIRKKAKRNFAEADK
jgi:hypothetical protein